MSLVPADALGASTAPFADAARSLLGDWARADSSPLGAAISCFGALNGWILLAGQLPLAVARDGLFPPIFGRTSSRGTPAAAMVIGGILTTLMVGLNYTRGLVELFTFMILLATLNTLIPYAFSSMAVFVLPGRGGRPVTAAARPARHRLRVFALGHGRRRRRDHLLGFLLLMAGLPVYVIVNPSSLIADR